MLPDIDGREICRRIRAADDAADRPPTPILMLTALSTVADRVAGFEAGADDYLPKPFDVKELALRVRALMRRVQEPRAAPALATDVLRFENLVVDLGSRAVVRGERPVRLTAREFDLLALFMRHPNQVLPHALVLERVWGRDTLGDSNVLPVTIGTLRQALEADGESRLIQTVRGVGYVLRAA
jgi:two-component system response regulator MprA